MLTTSILIVVFCVLFALTMLIVSSGLRVFESEHKKKVEKALGGVASRAGRVKRTSLLDGRGDATKRSALVENLPFYRSLQKMIEQAGMDWPAGRLLVLMVAGALIGLYTGSRVDVPVYREAFALGLGVLLGSLPFLYVSKKRTKRLNAFEEQFPDSLDFMARALQAGHAFSVSLEMLGSESPEPTATEFRQVYNTQNLGSPLEVSLRELARRVPLIDVRFFASAVLTQRETGGNLAAILTNLAFVIRERFRLKGHVKAASAHGRLTAGVLTVLPIITALLLMLLSPGYLERLVVDEDGKWLVIGAMLSQLVGYYIMRRIINIRV